MNISEFINKYNAQSVSNSSMHVTILENHHYVTVVADEYFRSIGLNAAIPAAMFIPLDNDDNIIVVTSSFVEQDNEYKSTVIAHEEGHIVLHRELIVSGEIFKNPMRCMEIEYEADAYALSKGCNVRKMLERLEESNNIDLTDRIMNLK